MGLILLLAAMAALGTIGLRIEPYPKTWDTDQVSAKTNCGIIPGTYSLSGERIHSDPRYTRPTLPLRFFAKSRHDKPFGASHQRKGADKISFSFTEESASLTVTLLNSEGLCLGSIVLQQADHYRCRGDWLVRELPHRDAEPIVGPHGHSVKLRSQHGYLEARRKNWMIGFLYILPGANFSTKWMRFKRVADTAPASQCPGKDL